jgi:hypothetical protein
MELTRTYQNRQELSYQRRDDPDVLRVTIKTSLDRRESTEATLTGVARRTPVHAEPADEETDV